MKKTFKYLLIALLGVSVASCGNQKDPKGSESSSERTSISESESKKESSIDSSSSVSSDSTSEKESESVSEKESESVSESESSSEAESVSESESASESTSETEVEQNVPGVISLDNSTAIPYSKTTAKVKYGNYSFEVNGTSQLDDGYVSLSKGGYLLNTTAFGDIDSFKVEYSKVTPSNSQLQSDLGFGSLYYVTDTHKITSPRSYSKQEVENNQTITLKDNPNYIAFYTFNQIEIKSITINYNNDASYTESFSNFDVQLFSTNDIHGQVNADDTHAGLVNAAGYIEKLKEKTKYNMVFDQGDIYQGSLACYLTQGHIMDDYLLMEGYESTILGNHEWDWKENNILEHREYSPNVKLLACNVRYKDGSTPSWVNNYYITERGGVKFGVIGAVGDIERDISADMIENIKFLTGKDLESMISTYCDELKEAGCDYIILQLHEGSSYSGKKSDVTNSQYESLTYSSLQGKLDLVLESHSHKSYFHTDEYGIKHIQCGGYLNGLGRITLHVTFDGNKPTITFADSDVYLNNATYLKGFSSDLFNEVNEWYSTNIYKEESERKVATISSSMNQATVEQLQAEAYLALKDRYSELATYNVVVAGGHIGARSPQKLEEGDVTMSDVTNLFPFDNEMYLVKIGGRDLKYNFLKESNKLAGEMNSSSTTIFTQYYYAIIDSYNYFYLTKQLKTPSDVSIVVNLTELYGIHPRDAFAMYLSDNYPVKEYASTSLANTDFDFTKSSVELTVKENVTVTIYFANLKDNANYNQFVINKNNGEMTFTCSEGYKIVSISVSQYQTYKNLTFFSDEKCENGIDYTVSNSGNNVGEYTISNTTNTIVIKNSTNYDVKVNAIKITLEKVQ